MVSATTFESFNVETLERLVVPAEKDTLTPIPFGIDGTSVVINRYGEILNILQYVADDNPKMIALDTYEPYYPYMNNHSEELGWQSENQRTGLHLRLMSMLKHEVEGLEPSLEWVNGRWPHVSYELEDFRVSVQFTVEQGVISQQFLIKNTSNTENHIRYALQAEGSTVTTLHVEDDRWEMYEDFDWSAPKPQVVSDLKGYFTLGENKGVLHQDHTTTDDDMRSEAILTVFHNGVRISSEDIVLIPVEHETLPSRGKGMNDLLTSRKRPNILCVPPHGVQELLVQYKLRFDHKDEMPFLDYLDVGTFLLRDQHYFWSFKDDSEFNTIFRRQLEHILCLCLVNVIPHSKSGPRVPFDTTLASGSTPAGDLFVFRFLLYMYQILGVDDYVVFSTTSSPSSSTTPSAIGRMSLQSRIKKVCQSHLRWCFDKDVFFVKKSWPISKNSNNVDGLDDDPGSKSFTGSLHLLKLFEFSLIFHDDNVFIEELLQACAHSWLDVLDSGRDMKSNLWYRTKKTYVPWEGQKYEESEMLNLPEYRLGELIYIWKALMSVEQMTRRFATNPDLLSSILQRIDDLRLQHYEVRKLILLRFLCLNPDTERNDHPSSPSDLSQRDENSNAKPNLEADQNSYRLIVAVRRSRVRDRILFYAKDTMVYEGFEWGFFENDLELGMLNPQNEVVKPDVALAWKRTLDAQRIHKEIFWKKSQRYALAISMASCGQSLDDLRDPADLANISCERLLGVVTSCGLLTSKVHWESKVADTSRFLDDPRSTWEISTVLLRHRFKLLNPKLQLEKLPVLVPIQYSENCIPKQTAVLESDTAVAWKAKSAMKKRIKLEKERTRSSHIVNVDQVSDPIERRMKDWLYPFPSFFNPYPLYKSILDEIDNLDRRLDTELKHDLSGDLRENLTTILKKGASEWTSTDACSSKFAWSSVIVRFPRYMLGDLNPRWCFPELLEEYLHEARKIESAKKMFHYFGPFQATDALALYLTTPFTDRYDMASFITRHRAYEIHFHENVHPLADIWATELHLSFIQLVDKEQQNINEAYGYVTVCDGHQRPFPHAINGSELDVFQASLSYRFVGDMADRFWSGYLLSYLPKNSKLLKNPDFDVGSKNLTSWFHSSAERDQRKILEPFLVEKMAGEIYKSTKVLLDSVNDWLSPAIDSLDEKGVSSKPNQFKAQKRNFDVRYVRSTTCLEIDSILNMLRRLSEENLYSLDQWGKREETRQYKPRWTEKDEFRYGDLVDIQRKRASQQIFLLHDQYRRIQSSIDQVKSHRQELIDTLSLAESRVAANNAENVRIFTYATVIFYPLSFLSSFFSMQGLPNHDTIIIFIKATAIALTVTLVIVFNVETIIYPIRRLRFTMSQQARQKMAESSSIFPVAWKKSLEKINRDEKQDVSHDNEPPRPPRSKLIYLLFLVVYLLVEYPAKRITLAYESLTNINFQDNHQLFLTIGRILYATILLPVFVPSWVVVALWTLIPLAMQDVVIVSGWIWAKYQKRYIKRLKQGQPEESERGVDVQHNEQSKEKEIGPGRLRSPPHVEKSNPEGNRFLTTQDRLREKQTKDRQDRNEQLQKQVSLIINPPMMMDHFVWSRLRARHRSRDDGGTQV